MTTNWKSTINRAYTNPNLLHPTLEKSIPSLIRDEVSRLANLTLFQSKVRANSTHSQIPVDMKFTDDSLHIRISQKADWISLVPSTKPMSPEEKAVDAIRKEVMEKIALLWGGIPDNASDESDSGHTSSSGFSTEPHTSTSRRTRSRRRRRAEHNRRLNRGRGDFTTISGNTIDSSTHTTTNNYYGTTGFGSHSPNTEARTDGREETTLRRDMDTQTDLVHLPPGTPPPEYQSSAEESHSSGGFRESSDSSSDESKKSFSSFSDKSKREKKSISDISDTESESSYYPESSDESEFNSRSSFSIKSDINDISECSEPDSTQDLSSTIHDLEKIASDFERVISREKTPITLQDLDISGSEDEMSTPDIPDLMTFSNDEDSIQVLPSAPQDLENIGFQFEKIKSEDTKVFSKKKQGTSTEDSVKKDASTNTVLNEPNSTSTEIDPGLFSEKAGHVDNEVQTEQDLFEEKLVHSPTQSIYNSEVVISSKDISRLYQFINDSLSETNAFIEIANNMEAKVDSQLNSSILANQAIFQELQDIIGSEPQLTKSSDKIDTLLHRLDLDALQLIHYDPTLEIPYLDPKDSSSDSSTLVNSIKTSVESEESEDNYIDDEIKDQPVPTYMQSSGSFNSEDSDEDIETLFDGIQSWINNPVYIDPTSNKETQSASTQTDIYSTENEAQLQKQPRKLQEAFERTKSTHKNELASLLREQDRLASTANEKIKQILQNSIQNEKESFSTYQHLYEKYNKLEEDSKVEIEDLKKKISRLSISLKKLKLIALRAQFYAPAPIIISEKEKIETKTQSIQVENTGKPTNSTGESKSVTVKTNLPKVPKQKGSLHDRNLQAANLMMLRKEKAALEYAIQKNQFSKTDLTTKKDLLRRIDEELVRRNQKPQKASTSTMTKETKTKAPLTRDERDLKDLGKEPFTTLKTKLNDKHTNNK